MNSKEMSFCFGKITNILILILLILGLNNKYFNFTTNFKYPLIGLTAIITSIIFIDLVHFLMAISNWGKGKESSLVSCLKDVYHKQIDRKLNEKRIKFSLLNLLVFFILLMISLSSNKYLSEIQFFFVMLLLFSFSDFLLFIIIILEKK